MYLNSYLVFKLCIAHISKFEVKIREISKLAVLIVSADADADSSKGRMLDAIKNELESSDICVNLSTNSESVKKGIRAINSGVDAIVVDWNLPDAADIIRNMRSMDSNIGIFLMTDPESLSGIPFDLLSKVNEYLWILGDTPSFIAGRIEASMKRYRKEILPPMFKSLVEFSEDYEYSWHTPGHTAGTAFLKTPVGRLFYNFFGEQLFRSDLSISVGELGSLLDHSGPIGDAEKYASKVFGSDMTFFVTNGTSTSNRVVHVATTSPGDIEIVDRNCHKSLEHSITMSHAIPVYMMPTKNRYGILGPILSEGMSPDVIKKKIIDNKLIKDKNSKPSMAVVTNSTYDGVCYNAAKAEKILGKVTDCVHFDEAWYGYARFNELYKDRFAMRDDDSPSDERPTVFATQSTHKLLAALSQASMIHIKEGRKKIEPTLFNEAFMMHASTSPQYAIIASLDVSSKMMDSNGKFLTQDSIDEAVRFRQTMARIKRSIKEMDQKDWWFNVWQPDTICLTNSKEKQDFADVPAEILEHEPNCWILHPGETWHGFGDIEDGWAMLDPIKVTVLTPGMEDNGEHSEFGIPSAVVLAFLDQHGIVNEKSGDYNILFLFSMGVTNGKWGTLVSELFQFKKLFDRGALLDDAIPNIVSAHPKRYSGMTLAQLAKEMHEQIKSTRQTQIANEACSILPEQVMTPADAYTELVRGNVEHVKIDDIDDRIVATGIVPYPPGIPLLMPGERTGKNNGPILSYLRALEEFDRKFPGFEHDSHGVEVIDHDYYIYCIKE